MTKRVFYFPIRIGYKTYTTRGTTHARLLYSAPLACVASQFTRRQRVVSSYFPLLQSQSPFSARLKDEWLAHPGVNLISGLLVALALIPEAIGFSIVCGLDPKFGLYASFIIAVTIAFAGGRAGMISAATGAIALALVPLLRPDLPGPVRPESIELMFAAAILAGVWQLVFGWRKLGRYMKYVPKPVMTGFVNALAILIFIAQLPQFHGANWTMFAFVAAGLAIIYGLPVLLGKLPSKAGAMLGIVPSPLVAIVVLTIVAATSGIAGIRTVGDMGEFPTALPIPHLPRVPLSATTLSIIVPLSLTIAMIGLIESLLTAQLLDDLTETGSDKSRESRGQGLANIASSFLGGMPGCAMIGQSMINFKSGGRTRLSTLAAGVFLLVLILVLGKYVQQMPMGALVAVMIMVSISTFDWGSIRKLKGQPRGEATVMLATVGTTVLTHDLSRGVIVGVILSALFFLRRISKMIDIESFWDAQTATITHEIHGQMFFASTTAFLELLDDYAADHEPARRLVLDFRGSHLWDGSAVAAVDKVVLRDLKRGLEVEVIGLNEASEGILDRLAVHRRDEEPQTVALH